MLTHKCPVLTDAIFVIAAFIFLGSNMTLTQFWIFGWSQGSRLIAKWVTDECACLFGETLEIFIHNGFIVNRKWKIKSFEGAFISISFVNLYETESKKL